MPISCKGLNPLVMQKYETVVVRTQMQSDSRDADRWSEVAGNPKHRDKLNRNKLSSTRIWHKAKESRKHLQRGS